MTALTAYINTQGNKIGADPSIIVHYFDSETCTATDLLTLDVDVSSPYMWSSTEHLPDWKAVEHILRLHGWVPEGTWYRSDGQWATAVTRA